MAAPAPGGGPDAAGGERKRKRVAPVLVGPVGPAAAAAGGGGSSSSTAAPPTVIQQTGAETGNRSASTASSAAQASKSNLAGTLWAVDQEEGCEVRAQPLDPDNWLVRGLREGKVVWDHVVVGAPVHRLCIGGGFVALASGPELQVLSSSSGRMIFPPMVLRSPCLSLLLSPKGQLMSLQRDASLAVWDISAVSSIVQTSLEGLCQPSDLDLLDLRPETGEPFVVLKDGRLLLFQLSLGAWTTLSHAGGLAALPAPSAPSSNSRPQRAGGDEMRMESDLLVAACLGDKEEFRGRLSELVMSYGQQDPARLRSWCAALLGCSVGSSSPWEWLPGQLRGMGLEGKKVLEEVVLAGLGRGMGPGAQELRAELEAQTTPEQISSAF